MENIENILYDRLIKGKKVYRHYFENYKMDKIIFESDFKSILTCLKKYRSEFVVRSYKLFKSKVDNDLKIYKWNKKYESKKQKQKVFEDFCKISHDGKSSKKDEKIPKFYDVLKDKYDKQTKRQLKSELTWISQSSEIKEDEHICYYCGISQNILSILYNDPKFTCKTKRNRGSWFELDADNQDHAGVLARNQVDKMNARGATCWRVVIEGELGARPFYNYFAGLTCED